MSVCEDYSQKYKSIIAKKSRFIDRSPDKSVFIFLEIRDVCDLMVDDN